MYYKNRNGTKLIGIRFSDNDFYYTITSFLHMLIPHDNTHHMCHDLNFDKSQIVQFFNNTAVSLYLIKQNGFRYASENVTNGNYLHIAENNVYLDSEVTEFIDKYGSDNGEFHWVDLCHSQVYTI